MFDVNATLKEGYRKCSKRVKSFLMAARAQCSILLMFLISMYTPCCLYHYLTLPDNMSAGELSIEGRDTCYLLQCAHRNLA